nr:PREDICTED: uncharacterized protein C1orf158 homolog [Apteryx mantelli mantelli]
MTAPQIDGQDWWKTEPKYSSKVLIGNWLEERKGFIKVSEKLSNSTYRTDFIYFPNHKPDQTSRRTFLKRLEGLPKQHFFSHHEEPSSRNLVSEHDDNYNRHGHNTLLPPLRRWNGQPPTNYGLLEQLMKKWHKKEAGVMNSVYTVSYEKPPVSAFATCQIRQPAITHDFSSSQGHLPHNVSTILDYEGAQKYPQVLGQLARDTTN